MTRIIRQIVIHCPWLALARSASVSPPITFTKFYNISNLNLTSHNLTIYPSIGIPQDPTRFEIGRYVVAYGNYAPPLIPFSSARDLLEQAETYLYSFVISDPFYHGPTTVFPLQGFYYANESLHCDIYLSLQRGIPGETMTYGMVEATIWGAQRLIELWGKENNVKSSNIVVFKGGRPKLWESLAAGGFASLDDNFAADGEGAAGVQ
ncbi:MAG: hypothetical protein Q9163_003946 [Psora crenata]